MAEIDPIVLRIGADLSAFERAMAELRAQVERQGALLAAGTGAQARALVLAREQLVAEEARVRALQVAGSALDRQGTEMRRQARELDRLAGGMADRLVAAGRSFIDGLFDDSRDFWQDFADLGRRSLAEIAAEALLRQPATAFAGGLVGGGLGSGSGGAGGLLGGLVRQAAGSAVSDALGLQDLGSSIGALFGLGGGLPAGFVGPPTAAQAAASAGLFGGGGFLGLGAVGGPLALGGLALGGTALLSGAFDRPSVGPNAGARITLDDGRFVLGATGSDNGGERYLAQAESEALAAAETLNRVAAALGRSFDAAALHTIPDPGLAVQFGDAFRRTGGQLVEAVLGSGALGELTDRQVAAALGGGDVLAPEIEALRQALGAADPADGLREARRVVEQARREEAEARRDALAAELDAQADLVAALADAAAAFVDATRTLGQGLDSLLLADASPLTPAERLDEARRQFDAAVAAGDAGRAVAAGHSLAREGAGVLGSATPAGAALFTDVVATLRQLEAEAAGQAAGQARAIVAAEAELALLRDQAASLAAGERVSADQLDAARRQVDLLGRQAEVLSAVAAALAGESPDAAILRGQLAELERIGLGQEAVATAVAALLQALDGPAPAPPSAGGAAATPAPAAVDRFAAWAAEVARMREMDVGSFADGGVVRRPTLAVIGEAGEAEAVIPLKGGAVPVRITGGGLPADGLRALVEIGAEQVDALARVERRLAAMESNDRQRLLMRAVGSG